MKREQADAVFAGEPDAVVRRSTIPNLPDDDVSRSGGFRYQDILYAVVRICERDGRAAVGVAIGATVTLAGR